jgi:hypothetical protein
VKTFEQAYGAKFPKAVAKITDDVEVNRPGFHAGFLLAASPGGEPVG